MLHFEKHIVREDAEWIVFIHGAGGGISTWKYQREAFRPYFNLLFMDLRDHGLSKNMQPEYNDYNFGIIADDVTKVLDHLEIKKAHFLSLSLGSVMLQEITQRRPDLVDKMVMAGGVFRATLLMKTFVHSAKFLSYFVPYRIMYDLFSWIIMPRKNHQTSRQVFRLQSYKITPKEYFKWVGLYKDFFRLLRIFFNEELKNKSLIVMGDQDHVFFQAARRFVEKQEQARLVIFEKCGHICNIERYEQFNAIALEFLRDPLDIGKSKRIDKMGLDGKLD